MSEILPGISPSDFAEVSDAADTAHTRLNELEVALRAAAARLAPADPVSDILRELANAVKDRRGEQ